MTTTPKTAPAKASVGARLRPITKQWLQEQSACSEGIEWVVSTFGDPADPQEFAEGCVEQGHIDYLTWYLERVTFPKQDEGEALARFHTQITKTMANNKTVDGLYSDLRSVLREIWDHVNGDAESGSSAFQQHLERAYSLTTGTTDAYRRAVKSFFE